MISALSELQMTLDADLPTFFYSDPVVEHSFRALESEIKHQHKSPFPLTTN